MNQINKILAEVTPIPNQYFWYIIAGVFGTILLWLIKRDMDKKDDLLTKITEAVQYLTIRSVVHDKDIEALKKDVSEMKDQ